MTLVFAGNVTTKDMQEALGIHHLLLTFLTDFLFLSKVEHDRGCPTTQCHQQPNDTHH